MFKIFIAIVLVLLTIVDGQKFLTTIRAGNKPIGLYYNYHDPETTQIYENLLQILQPGEEAHELNPDTTIFVLRSSDLQTRVRVEVVRQDEEIERPYGIILSNLAHYDRGGAKPVEIKHGNSGYIWIEPTHNIAHVTGSNVPFEIYDTEKKLVASITIHDHHDEL